MNYRFLSANIIVNVKPETKTYFGLKTKNGMIISSNEIPPC